MEFIINYLDMATEDIRIQMKLLSVEEVRFVMLPDEINDNLKSDDILLGFSNEVITDIDNDIITLVFGIQYESERKKVLESVCRISFNVNNLTQFIVNDGKNSMITHIMPHLLNVVVGTMRGILVARTAGTILSKYPLPMINVEQLNSMLSSQVE